MPTLSTAQLDKAVGDNEHYGEKLGWNVHGDRIAQAIGVPPEAAPQAFAQAVADWQGARGLKADGVVGPITWRALEAALAAGGAEPATPLAPRPEWSGSQRAMAATYARLGVAMGELGGEVGCPLPTMLAVWHVESSGRRHVPGAAVIRFENHRFFQLWGAREQAAYDLRFQHGSRAGVAGKPWQNHRYREDASAPFVGVHGSQASEYSALALARSLGGDDAALQSISIGGSQVLVSNHRMLGYATPRAMYDAFQADERAHVAGFVAYCQECRPGGILRLARDGQWESFAAAYNGAGNAAHYGSLLREAHDGALGLGLPA